MSKADKLVSIIIPIYRVEKYLNRCIRSVVNQTHKNLEIILVDDGSPDACPQMCDEWAEKDGRIKVIHKKNGGLSQARNAGLDVMGGDFVSFLDSDDYLDENYVEILLDRIFEYDADIAACSMKNIYEKGAAQGPLYDKLFCMDNQVRRGLEILEGYYADGKAVYLSANAKLYRKTVFNSIRFPDGKLHEDAYVFPQIYINDIYVSCCSEQFYFYCHRFGSITESPSDEELVSRLDYRKYALGYYRDKSGKLYAMARKSLLDSIIMTYSNMKDGNARREYKILYIKLTKELFRNECDREKRLKYRMGMANLYLLSLLSRLYAKAAKIRLQCRTAD